MRPSQQQRLNNVVSTALHSASAFLSTTPPSTPLSKIEQYWRSKTVPAKTRPNTSHNSSRRTKQSKKSFNKSNKTKKRPRTAAPRQSPIKSKSIQVRSRVVNDALLESDVAWTRVLDRSVGFKSDILHAYISESTQRARRHSRQTEDLNNSMRNEKNSRKRQRKAMKLKRLASKQTDMSQTLLPDDSTNGGLEGRELKSWKILMKRHAEVVSTANVRIHSKLEKHVEHRRKQLKKQSKVRFDNATAEDGGMTGNQLQWWKLQRELHDKVVNTASVRIDTVHEKHVTEEWERKKQKRIVKDKLFDPADGGLEGPEKKHWKIMSHLHDEMIEDAVATIDTKLDKHVLEYREALEKKKNGPDGEREAGLDGRELKSWKMFQKVHDKIIGNAKAREDTHLGKHEKRYRQERQARSHKRFLNYDISSGGLQGPELKLAQHLRKTHDRVVNGANVRIDVTHDKHVLEEWKNLKIKSQIKWDSYDPDINGGKHGVELEHWKIMHALHDELIATAKPTISTRLDKHVKEYRNHVKKKLVAKWKEKDNAGLSGRELKWWREQLEMYHRLINNSKSTMLAKNKHEVGDMELPHHVENYRSYLQKERKKKLKTRSINDGMLSGPNLEHWKIMTKIHDELISTATKTIDVKHEPHVQHHIEYVKDRNLKRWDPKKGFTAGLDGPELHHWHEMTKLHERVIGAAKSQVDCHRVKSVAELVMEQKHEKKWGTKPHTATYNKKKKKPKRIEIVNGVADYNPNLIGQVNEDGTPLLTEAEYERALEIAAVIQKEIYSENVNYKSEFEKKEQKKKEENEENDLPTWNGVREMSEQKSSSKKKRNVPLRFANDAKNMYGNNGGDERNDQEVADGKDTGGSFTRRRLEAALEAANNRAATSPSTRRVIKGSPLMLSPPKGRPAALMY